MRWDGPAIASYARQAGFWGRHEVDAVALALVVSEGDSLAYVPAAGSRPALVGLFGIPVHGHETDDEVGWLHGPLHNADAAYDLWDKAGHTFRWSWMWPQVERSGMRQVAAEIIGAEVKSRVGGVLTPPPPGSGDGPPLLDLPWAPVQGIMDGARMLRDLTRE